MNKFVIALSIVATTACGGGGAASATARTPAPAPAPAPAENTSVSIVQGSGVASALLGQTVSIRAIVSGDFQNNDADSASNLGGFYVQQETPDGDIETSDGVFIYDGSNPETDVSVGDRVEITGTVNEYFGETQISASSVRITGTGVLRVTNVLLPTTATTTNSDGREIADLERYEGMLLRFPQQLTVSNLRHLERYGEVGLSNGGRAFQFTNSHAPDATAYAAYRKVIASQSIVLDDGLRSTNPVPIRHLNSGVAKDYSIRVGDSIVGASGNLRFSRGSGGNGEEAWRLVPTGNALFDDANPRPGAPSLVGSTRVASFNVLNFFSGIDVGKTNCGPLLEHNCRGADSVAELSRQLEKIVTAMAMMEADIIGLIELENNASASIVTIVEALNKRVGNGAARYAFIDTGPIHSDAIKTAFIYDSSTIQATGSFAILDSGADARFDDSRNRPALAQSFRVITSGAVMTVIVNHLKSKGSSCDSIGDPNSGDGQGNCSGTRTDAAAAIANWIGSDPTASGDSDFLIIGDLNSYLMEEPLTVMKEAGLSNLFENDTTAYSFVFDAMAGALDHAIASPSLVAQVKEIVQWHINSDEPPLLDYNLENDRDPSLFDANSPYRASDHDPVIIGLDLSD